MKTMENEKVHYHVRFSHGVVVRVDGLREGQKHIVLDSAMADDLFDGDTEAFNELFEKQPLTETKPLIFISKDNAVVSYRALQPCEITTSIDDEDPEFWIGMNNLP